MVFTARLTQRGHQIHTMADLMKLYEMSYSPKTLQGIASLPHPTVRKFSLITVAVVGASRRFLSQITRHQNEVKFMSASLQYSNYSDQADFVIPYEILAASEQLKELYIKSCVTNMECYKKLFLTGIDHDCAGYVTPQALRNVLIISATPFQWSHMIGQRICRRNTDEMRIVMLKIWAELYALSPDLFSQKLTGTFCQRDYCREGKMCCQHSIPDKLTPKELLACDYPLLVERR